ncbi:CTP synthase (glutamine hydrolyzing) [Candidatus Woesearchaeota archaeon]|nr:CTP synthase (glutamine hydrolyzing) [Candidatus Woesearchaeota archaeon]
MRTKYIIVTGGVLSGLGKGIVAASIGRLLTPTYNVVPVKCDGYLNVDPGTMNPVEHGEVFVLDDGGEVDLDFGHYERFLNRDCKFEWNLTSGKIFKSLVEKERKGEFLGKTVQVIPHVTGEIRERWKSIAKKEKADILLIEIGGTVGDLENLWFLEAARELAAEVDRKDILFVHMGLLPVIDGQGQQKTKPMQQSLLFLRERGLIPRVLIGRSKERLTEKTKERIGFACNVPKENVFSDPNVTSVYEIPLILEEEGLRKVLADELDMKVPSKLGRWSELVHAVKDAKKSVSIAVCGKYTELADSYLSIQEALFHAGAHNDAKVHLRWVETSDIEKGKIPIKDALKGCDGVIVPGGFGSRGVEGKINVIQYLRENKIPFLGICYGMQLAVIEYARSVCGLGGANTTEVNASTSHPVIDILPEQRAIAYKGGTMRLGGHNVEVKKASKASGLYGALSIRERFRHRYEVNPQYVSHIESAQFRFSGKAPNQPIMQLCELSDHPFFVGTQFHPELTSRLERPSPLFLGLIAASLKCKEQKFKLWK